MKKVLLVTLILFLGMKAWPQYTISGTVKDSRQNAPLAGAHVMLDESLKGFVTDASGSFTIPDASKGEHELKTSFVGYGTDTRTIRINGDVSVNIVLNQRAILENEVVIRSTRAAEKTPLTYQDISRRDIEKANLSQDIPFVLSNSISAVATSDAGNGMGYTALRIRGTDMTRINVTINGIPLNDPESHNVFWVDLPDFATSTDNIQIQRGVGTSTNGAAAFGASINLLSSSIRQEPYGEVAASFGSFNSSKLSASFGSGLIHEHWSVNGRVSSLQSDGYIDRASSKLSSYFLSGAYSGEKDILRFNIFSGDEKTYQAWDGIPHEILDTNRRYNGMGAYYDRQGNLHYYADETDKYRQTHYQLTYSRQLRQHLLLNLAAHYTHGEGYYEQYRDDEDFEDYGIAPIRLPGNYYLSGSDTISVPDSLLASGDLIRRKWLDNDFAGITYALSFDKGKFQSSVGGSWNTYTGRHFGRVIWSEFPGSFPYDYEWYRNKARKKDFNMYAKTSYALNKKISILADLQIRNITYWIDGIDDDSRNISQDHDFTFFNPKAGIYYTVNESNSLYASVAIASREPNRDNFVDADLTKELPSPETLYDAELGYTLQTDKLSLGSNLYYMYYHDQLVLTGAINDVGASVMENVPESYRLGMEVSLRLKLARNLSWHASSTLSRNKINRYTEYVDNWDTWSQESFGHRNTDLSFSPSLLANSELEWRPADNLTLSLVSKYVGKQYLDNTQDESRRLDPYLVNDARISFLLHPKLFRELRLSLFLNNFLNESYESNAWVYKYKEGDEFKVLDGYFPQAGFNFLAGCVFKL